MIKVADLFRGYKNEETNKLIKDLNGKVYITIKEYVNSANNPCVMIWVGNRSAKPLYRYSFINELKRAEFINKKISEHLNSHNNKLIENAKIKENLKSYIPQIKVGDILHYQFGYSMTLNEFYQVTDIKGKTVTIRELNTESKPTGWLQMDVRPIRNSFRGEEIKKRLQVKQYSIEHKPCEYVVIDSYTHGLASVCDENEWFYENHAD